MFKEIFQENAFKFLNFSDNSDLFTHLPLSLQLKINLILHKILICIYKYKYL